MAGNHAARRASRNSLGPDVFEAFRATVFGYPGGVDRLATRMGVRAGTLYNKADASDDSHHQPTLRDVLLVCQITNDLRVLDALEQIFGRSAFDVAELADVSDEDLLILLTRLGQRMGNFQGAISDGLNAKRFSPQAMRDIRAQAFDAIATLMTLTNRLEDLVDDGDRA
jgi:hypothetical protein